MKTLNLLFIIFAIVACAKDKAASTNESNKYPSPYVPASPVSYSADVYANQGVNYSLDITSNILNGLPAASGHWEYELTQKPSWMSIDLLTGVITGLPQLQGVDNFTVKATDSNNTSNTYSETVSIAVNGDPLRVHQWHLKNTAQTSFALHGGISGNDINVFPAYEAGYDGSGIKIAVSDSGGEINHDDLYENIIDGASKDYTLSPPYLGNPIATSAHGTAVSGIIAARGWNNIGGNGIAPKANLAIFQFIESSQSLSVLIDQASGNFDIYNYSYGDTLYFDTQSDADYIDHLRYQTKNGRGGKGSFFIKAAGNEFIQYDDQDSPTYCASHNANFPFENESPFLIVVGAINADGYRSSYSSTGSNIWVSAPGGEYGFNDPAMVTTDLPTCFKGYSKAAPFVYNDFEYGHALNKNCNYTSTMNGTSSATPVVSGVIALILEANPNLTHREVKHILALTSTQVDGSFINGKVGGTSGTSYGTKHPSYAESGCVSRELTGHTYEQGWVTNKAGINFSNAYGFGLVNVEAAIAMAKDDSLDDAKLDWLPNMPALVETNPNFTVGGYSSGTINKSIPDNNKDGVTDTITVSSSLDVETVQIKVQVTHPKSGQIGIELTSPGLDGTGSNGTKSILMNINNSFLLDGDSNLNITLSSHAFYGEPANGTWTIKVIDGLSGNQGQLVRWDLNILGH